MSNCFVLGLFGSDLRLLSAWIGQFSLGTPLPLIDLHFKQGKQTSHVDLGSWFSVNCCDTWLKQMVVKRRYRKWINEKPPVSFRPFTEMQSPAPVLGPGSVHPVLSGLHSATALLLAGSLPFRCQPPCITCSTSLSGGKFFQTTPASKTNNCVKHSCIFWLLIEWSN